MKILQIALITVLNLVFFTKCAVAQNTPLACLVEEASGLFWESGRWTQRLVTPSKSKFILVLTSDGLSKESVSSAFNIDYPNLISCRNMNSMFSCSSLAGAHLYFDLATRKGGMSKMFGSTVIGNERDSVSVQVFSCSPF
jgi:hypothetical protein